MIIPDALLGNAVLFQQGANPAGAADDLPGSRFSGFLLHIIPVQKVHRMGKDRGADIVKQPGDGLLPASGKMPDDQGHAQAVLVAGGGRAASIGGIVGIFAAAVHAHAL